MHRRLPDRVHRLFEAGPHARTTSGVRLHLDGAGRIEVSWVHEEGSAMGSGGAALVVRDPGSGRELSSPITAPTDVDAPPRHVAYLDAGGLAELFEHNGQRMDVVQVEAGMDASASSSVPLLTARLWREADSSTVYLYPDVEPTLALDAVDPAWPELRALASVVVDEAFYLATYPDVRAAGVDPVAHFLEHGFFEHRDPAAAVPPAVQVARGGAPGPSWHPTAGSRHPLLDAVQGASRPADARRLVRGPQPKVFVIGANKTGTTSLEAALVQLGYRMGSQHGGEALLEDWHAGNFDRIVQFCESADAFQDVPFSLDGTYRALDEAFPTARFVLTVRDSPEAWFRSLVDFHAAILGVAGVPTVEDLKAYPHHAAGSLWRVHQLVFGIDEATLYDEAVYKAAYVRHNDGVRRHFAGRSERLLTLDLSDPGASQQLASFLDVRDGITIPHLNAGPHDAG